MSPSPEDEYRAWLRAAHGPAQSRRTAERNAAFFLPHLKPGMRLLDAGCGGGSITIGIARAVEPGQTVGVDLSAESIALAGALAAEQRVPLRLEVADAGHLPFEDASFDAVFSHALLQHVADPAAVVRELRRVLRPGGVIGIADADLDGALLAPDSAMLRRSTEILRRTRRHPDVGRRLRALLSAAGFERVQASATAGARGDALAVKLDGEFYARYFEAEPFIAYAVAQDWSTRDEMQEIAAAWRAWSIDSGAFSAAFWCHALGFAPK